MSESKVHLYQSTLYPHSYLYIGRNNCDEQNICTVKEGTPVDLICESCLQGIFGIQWFKWDKHNQEYKDILESKTIVHFDKVAVNMTGCYKCSCPYDGMSPDFIDLQVHPVQVGMFIA